MRTLLLIAGTASALAVTVPAHAAEDGPASVQLPQCTSGAPVSEVRAADCSYIALPGNDGTVYYGYLSSAGQVSWAGTASGGALSFPASGQQWPALAPLFSGIGSARVIPAPIDGSLSDTGAVRLTMRFTARIEALGSQCTASGTVVVATDTVDTVGGGVGVPLSGGKFAAAGTSTSAPVLDGNACAQASSYLDLSRGVGVYASGFLTLGGSSSGGAAGAQTAALRTPATIKGKGATVILKKAVTTNAGQPATATLNWSTKKTANGSSARLASARTTRTGKLTLRTTGRAKRLYVRLTVSAPAVDGYQEYLATKRWVVR